MAGRDWSIKIVATGPTTAFDPNPLQAGSADLVSWNNTTDEDHWPWPCTSDFTPLPESQARQPGTWLADRIPPHGPSTPAFLCGSPAAGSTTTIYYCCYLHQKTEQAKIAITGD